MALKIIELQKKKENCYVIIQITILNIDTKRKHFKNYLLFKGNSICSGFIIQLNMKSVIVRNDLILL